MPNTDQKSGPHNLQSTAQVHTAVVVPSSPIVHTTDAKEPVKQEKKATVLETHGYFLGKNIGQGSYATVKVAHSERHNTNVAVKIVSKFTAPSDYLKKFLPREIEVVKGLKHPNLIRFLQAIETTHRVYIVMEYAENGSLLDMIRKDSHIDETRARKWFRQLVDAIEYCHERGVVHRDIKCENMLMDTYFNIKLSDFGFARGHLKSKTGSIILSETFCGSYAYASPEILKGIPYQPQMSDVWSMGVVLYAMVFGRLPFDDTNYSQLVKQVSNKVTFPREPKVTTTVRALICKILAPLKVRVRIYGIRSDAWFVASEKSQAGTSRDVSLDSMPAASPSLGVDREAPISLLTKEQLNAQAKIRERHNSADEETPIGIQMPEDIADSETSENSSRKTSAKK